jgi:hypothetical protein
VVCCSRIICVSEGRSWGLRERGNAYICAGCACGCVVDAFAATPEEWGDAPGAVAVLVPPHAIRDASMA